LSLKNEQVRDSLYHTKIELSIKRKRLDSLGNTLRERNNELRIASKELKRISKLKDCLDFQRQLKKFREKKSLMDDWEDIQTFSEP
jgi:hypothetical protein